jgi:hypothetical protein
MSAYDLEIRRTPERAAIADERPLFNRTHNKRDRDATVDYLLDRLIAAGDLAAKLSSPKKEGAARGGKRVVLAAELERYLSELSDA